MLTVSLSEAIAAPAAARAIRDLCECDSAHMASCLPQLSALYGKALEMGAATRCANQSVAMNGTNQSASVLHEDDVHCVIEGVAVALCGCGSTLAASKQTSQQEQVQQCLLLTAHGVRP